MITQLERGIQEQKLQDLQAEHQALLDKSQENLIPVEIRERKTRRYLATFDMNTFPELLHSEALRLLQEYWVSQFGNRYPLTNMELQNAGKVLDPVSLVRAVREVWVDPFPYILYFEIVYPLLI